MRGLNRTMVLVAVLCGVAGGVSAQSPAVPAGSDFAVLLLEPPQPESVSRIWLAIRNTSQSPRLFCRSLWSYRWIPGDPDREATGKASASLEGCGDDAQGASWLLLPGEWRFDQVELETPPRGTYNLQVVVGLVERTPGRAGSSERTVTWSRPLSEALLLGDRLKSGQFR